MRAALLVAAIALTTGSLLATAILLQGLQSGIELGLQRLGADLMVVSRGALVNPQTTLLTGEAGQPPLPAELAARLEQLPGVARLAPQRVLRFRDPELCGPAQAELVAFDPARDFTVLSWVESDHLDRPFGDHDVVVGNRLPQEPGETFMNYTVWGRLASSGVGTHERGVFVSQAAIPREVLSSQEESVELPSALLLRLSPGFSVESLRFAIGANPGLRVVEGSQAAGGVRQSLVALLRGVFLLTLLMLVLTALLLGVLFSAIVAERRNELGILAAIGFSRRKLILLVAGESTLATMIGGLLGTLTALALLRLAQHTLLYQLNGLGVHFQWPSSGQLLTMLALQALICLLVGVLGGALPGWALTRQETRELLQSQC